MNDNNYQELDINSSMDQPNNQSLNSNFNNENIGLSNNNVEQNNNYNEMPINNQMDTYQDNDNINQDVYPDNEQQGDFSNDQPFESSEKKSLWLMIKWPVIIIGGLIILVILIILMAKACGNNKAKDPDEKYKTEYNLLTEATKDYLDNHKDQEPLAAGQCTEISLNDLAEDGLITDSSSEKLNTCDEEGTFVTACKLESGNLHYNVTFSCTNEDLKINYTDWIQGGEANLTDTSDIKFTYLPQVTEVSDAIAGSEEEIWKDEIKYKEDEYTVITTQTYYRVRQAVWNWTSSTSYFYPKDVTNTYKVSEYYAQAPAAGYTVKGEEATAYKWYVNSHEKWNETTSEAPNATYTVQGAEGPSVTSASETAPEAKTYRTIKSNQNIYRKRSLSKTQNLTKTAYVCTNGTDDKDSDTICTANTDDYKTIKSYKCYYDNSSIAQTSSTPCVNPLYTYGNWNAWSATPCTPEASGAVTCEQKLGYTYTDKTYEWYTPAEKTYFPSGSKTADGEITYYVNAPVANAIKETSTKATVNKYFKTIVRDYGLSTNSPADGAVRGAQDWGEWSEYTLSKPAENELSQIEERIKVKLTRTGSADGVNKKDLTNGYVSEQEMITAVKAAGYEVNSLVDIMNLSDVTYKVKLYYRTTTLEQN